MDSRGHGKTFSREQHHDETLDLWMLREQKSVIWDLFECDVFLNGRAYRLVYSMEKYCECNVII
jgi:hypothetical protein